MNATLIINNEKEFCNDIWQYKNNFTIEQWKEILCIFSEIVSETKECLEYLNLDDFGDDKLYQLGDIINFFNSIDIKFDK